MQFQKRGAGNYSVVGKLLVKIFLVIIVLFIVIALLNRVDFPTLGRPTMPHRIPISINYYSKTALAFAFMKCCKGL